jgi:predicted flap endonuclease-1-like 5' DNA nuclease
MRSSTSTASEEKLRSELKSAKKAAKKAKAAYKAKLKDLRDKIEPLKQAMRDAKAAEKQAKAAYKAAKGTTKKDQEPTGPNMDPVIPRSRAAQMVSQPSPAETPEPASTPNNNTGDDLTKVKGVGFNIAEMLRANGISSFADMAATSFDQYKELLKANGMSKFRDPSQWAARAAELANLPAPAPAAPKAADEPAAPRKRGRQPGFSPKAAKAAAGDEAPVAPKTKAAASKGNDNLTKVKGVGHNIAEMLKANGIASFADMAATSFDRYKELLKANGMSKFRDPSQWAARAAELANMPAPAARKAPEAPAAPKKRGRQPGFSPKANKAAATVEKPAAPKAKAAPTTGGDDLTKVKGVGDNIADMLKANGISTYVDMAGTSFDRYKELLKANGMSKFRDPSQWAARAAELANAPVEPAAEPKKRGRQPGFSPKANAAAKAASEDTAAPRKRGRQPGYSPKAAKAAAAAATEITPVVEAAPKAPARPKSPPAKPDDLTMVKGVGQRVADALNKEGIYTYRDMAEVSLEQYKAILKDNNMSKFRDPSDWARIAAELASKK